MYELKHSKAEIEARPLCPYNNKKRYVHMYNYKAVLVIHIRQTSVNDWTL